MINDAPLARFEALGDGRLAKPLYDYSFGNIPNTIEFLLTGHQHGPLLPVDCFSGAYPRVDKVALVFVDSFGWEFWRQYQDRFRTTRRVAEQGVVTPISALFPSTTAASVTTMNLGVLPAAHALYEWNIYIPAYGEVIQSLAFSPLGPRAPDGCLRRGYDPARLVTAHETVHQRLARKGARSIQFAHRAYARSAYNQVASAGAEIVMHTTPAEGMVQLKEAIASVSGKAWLNFYWASIDAIAHVHGPGTPYHAAEIANFWRTFDDVFEGFESSGTLFLFTADHGHIGADAAATLYINERWPQLESCLARSPTGNPIYPNGSPRDMFLHVRPERRDEVLALLARGLDGIAMVLAVDAALAEGLFGPAAVHPELRARLGDILVLPYLGQFVWWREPGLMQNDFHGHHGGLTRDEVITVLGATERL